MQVNPDRVPIYRQLPEVYPARLSPDDIEQICQNTVGPIIYNVVSSATDLTCPSQNFSLSRIAWLCGGSQNKRIFAAPCKIAVRSQERRMTVLLFDSHKMVMTGAPNEHAAVQCLMDTLKFIYERTGIVITPHSNSVTNIQSVVNMYCQLDLHSISKYYYLACNAQYEPTNINRVRLTMTDPRVTVLIYDSGRLVLTGASKREDLVITRDKIVPRLAHFAVRYINDPEERKRIEEETQKILEELDRDAQVGISPNTF